MKRKLNINSLNLPKEIKEKIADSVIELKDILKDDPDFAKGLITSIWKIGVSVLPEYFSNVVLDYYKKDSEEKLSIWTSERPKLHPIVQSLACLANGEDKLIFDSLKGYDPESLQEVYNHLIELSKKEICTQFDPNFDFSSSIEVSGANRIDDEDL